MNSAVANNRLSQVIQADSINVSDEDFLLTHVPMRGLYKVNSFSMNPRLENNQAVSEDFILQDSLLKQSDLHQLTVVYGSNGTGKSHLIRWLKTEYERTNPEDEVIVLIRRNDNTLKGTLKQLLNLEEFQFSEKTPAYQRLLEAEKLISEDHFKIIILQKLITAIKIDINDTEDDDNDSYIKNNVKKKLVRFLSLEETEEELFKPLGVIERIYNTLIPSKYGNTANNKPEFKLEDFNFSKDFLDKMEFVEDKRVKRFLHDYNYTEIIDSKDKKKIQQLILYLNTKIPEVIRDSSGIQSGDLKDLFQEMRVDLKKKGKNLTLFVEDLTAFSGINLELLDALMESHMGENQKSGMCRLRSIVGTTSSFLNENFRDNHKDRVNQYIYLPDNVLSDNETYELFARYLNAISITQEEASKWYINGADQMNLPIGQEVQGKGWNHYEVNGSLISLYPFSFNSIDKLPEKMLQNNKSPRALIRRIIEPMIRDAMNQIEAFPSKSLVQLLLDSTTENDLYTSVFRQVSNEEEAKRLLAFLTVWGNGKNIQENRDGITYRSNVSERVLQDLNLPLIRLNQNSINSQTSKQTVTKTDQPKPVIPTLEKAPSVNKQKADKLKLNNSVERMIREWGLSNKDIPFTSTVGGIQEIRDALKLLPKLVLESIDWDSEGLNYTIAQNTLNFGNQDFFTIEGSQNKTFDKNKNFLIVRNFKNTTFLTSLCIYKAVFKDHKSFNYDQILQSTTEVFSWIEINKMKIIDIILNTQTQNPVDLTIPDYIKAMFASSFVNYILSEKNENLPQKFKKISENKYGVIKSLPKKPISSKRSKQWNNFVEKMADSAINEELRMYYAANKNAHKKYIIDFVNFEKDYDQIVKLILKNGTIQGLSDSNKNRKKKYIDKYYDTSKKLQIV